MNQPRDLHPDELVRWVSSVMKPEFPHWVLFRFGTYVVLEDEAEQRSPEAHAVRRLKEFGPVLAGSPAGDFSVISLPNDGWAVAGHGRGIYTYVDPSELSGSDPTDVEIGLFGRAKRGRDSERLEVIHVNHADP